MADGAPFILHPLEVASLLSSCECRDEVTATAIVHDTIENTAVTGEQIEARFRSAIAEPVCCLTPLVNQLRFELEAIRDPPPAPGFHARPQNVHG